MGHLRADADDLGYRHALLHGLCQSAALQVLHGHVEGIVGLPDIVDGDILMIQDTGAHGHAMGFNYNGRLRPKELLLRSDGSVELIRREETVEDHFATLTFDADVIVPKGTRSQEN